VQDLGNGTIGIRTKQGPKASIPAGARISGQGDYTAVDILDTRLNLVLGSTLYDAKGETVSKTFYKYAFKSGQATPEAIYQEVWTTEADGKKLKATSNTYFYQISSTVKQ
jgi:hypothetical protein